MTASTPQPTAASVRSVALAGVDGQVIEIRAQLHDADDPAGHAWQTDETREVRERVRAAVRNSGHTWPAAPVTLTVPSGPGWHGWASTTHDLAAALAVLVASGQLPAETVAGAIALGELGLDGSLRSVRGVLPALLAARAAGLGRAIIPRACQAEAALMPEFEVTAADTLADLAGVFTSSYRAIDSTIGLTGADDSSAPPVREGDPAWRGDLGEVRCPPAARRALLIAAAGGHPIQLTGPGAGMLARRMPGLLPAVSDDQALEIAAIRSLAGIPLDQLLASGVPFVAPHYSTSLPALVGGGPSGKPGAVSLSCHGVLHLVDPEEFGVQRLDPVRVALDEGEVRLVHRGGAARFPTRFQLVLTRHNPTARRLPASLLDRIPIRVELPNPPVAEIPGPLDTTAAARGRVILAREWAAARWASIGGTAATNATVDARHLQQAKPLPDTVRAQLDRLRRIGALTERGALEVVRVAWTASDLDQTAYPHPEQVAEALALRGIDPADSEDQ